MSWYERRKRVGARVAAAVLMVVAGWLAGCATPPPVEVKEPLPVAITAPPAPPPQPEPMLPPPAPAVSEEAYQALSLLAESQHLSGLSLEEQKHEYGSVNQLVTKNKTEALRIKLAILLTLPAQQDDARALALLEGVAGKNAGTSPLKQLAALLAAQVSERMRVVREEQKRVEQLQQKLDGLKAIEKSLLGRDRKAQGEH